MRALLDTNIILDVLLRREPWVAQASELWRAHDQGRLRGHVMASAITDIFYVARKLVGQDLARKAVRTCLATFEICVVDRAALELAESLPGSDLEDNLQIACAQIARLDAIVTRDQTGFAASPVQTLSPADALARL
jgi:predicted nucleic acid-binding protein